MIIYVLIIVESNTTDVEKNPDATATATSDGNGL
jgi:hypothetical protein